MNVYKLKPHPFSQLFPSMVGSDYDHLLASVKREKRLRYSVIVYEGMILDGNQRLRACREARVEPKYTEFEGTAEKALNMVMDLNLARRQLTQSQKANAIAKATLLYEQGDRVDLRPGTEVTGDLAKKAGVSESTVERAKKILRHGTEEEKKALETGTAKAKPLAEAIRAREKQSDNGEVVDDNGTPVPVEAREYWNRKSEAKMVLGQISAARSQVKKLLPDDPMWARVNLNGVIADLNAAYNRFSSAVPAYVCPYCKGRKPDDCKFCKGRGVVSEFEWRTVPEELRKLHEIKGTLTGRILS
jgi:ParB-like chromosome segregation protein Spo0J